MSTMRLVMVIDTKRCIGCHTCSVACKIENNLSDGMWWNRVLGRDGVQAIVAQVSRDAQIGFLTLACQHCRKPACAEVCAQGAIHKRKDDGIVVQDYEKCIGCRKCIAACPYPGVRQFKATEPKYESGRQPGDGEAAGQRMGKVSMCTFCAHRLVKGTEPACIEVCPARARHFGNLKDPNSLVATILRDREYFRLLVEKGTDPSVYFLI